MEKNAEAAGIALDDAQAHESSDEEDDTALPPPVIRGASVGITPGGTDFELMSAPPPSADPTREISHVSAITANSSVSVAPKPYSEFAYLDFSKPRETAAAGPVMTWDVLDEAIWRIFKQVPSIPDPEYDSIRIKLFPEWSMIRQIGLRQRRSLEELPDRKITPNLYHSDTSQELSRESSQPIAADVQDLLVPTAGLTQVSVLAAVAEEKLKQEGQPSVPFYVYVFTSAFIFRIDFVRNSIKICHNRLLRSLSLISQKEVSKMRTPSRRKRYRPCLRRIILSGTSTFLHFHIKFARFENFK